MLKTITNAKKKQITNTESKHDCSEQLLTQLNKHES